MNVNLSQPRTGNTKATAEDWLRAARDTLVSRGVAHVKILALAAELGVSRSSFYWYYRDRTDLLAGLLGEWEKRNSASIVTNCALPAPDISHAVCNFFVCFLDDTLFDQGLDFAIREWARIDPQVRGKIDAADTQRLVAVTAMFEAHGYAAAEADARARILYYMQLGYHALDVREPLTARLARIEGYLKGFTGVDPNPELVASFAAKARRLRGGV
ncbi:MAG: TetR/AcrR family transcriptional regulator [Shimia sp.]